MDFKIYLLWPFFWAKANRAAGTNAFVLFAFYYSPIFGYEKNYTVEYSLS